LDDKGDLVRMTSEGVRSNGLKFGVFLSPRDRHEPKYNSSAEYDKYYLDELNELASNYRLDAVGS
jgi:alpha-L-fucosidase